MLPYGRQTITEGDIKAVKEVLESDFLTTGPKVPLFEEVIRKTVNSHFAVAVNSATSALHVACLALELGKNDILWTSPNTFVASANCGVYCGARLDFVDIDIDTGNICVETLEDKLKKSKATNSLPKILVSVHFSGQPTLQERIWELSKEYGFKIIEDASHALGAKRKSEPVGSCRWSDITVFSFHPVKIITSGEGGMATTNCKKLAEKMQLYRSHGITREKSKYINECTPESDTVNTYPFSSYYEQIMLGYNYRMNDIEAALGISQLKRLSSIIEERNRLAHYYQTFFNDTPLKYLKIDEENLSSYHLFIIRLPKGASSSSRNEVYNRLREKNIGVNLHYIPVHLQPFYRSYGFGEGDYPNAELYSQEALTLPLYPGLKATDQDLVISSILEVL